MATRPPAGTLSRPRGLVGLENLGNTWTPGTVERPSRVKHVVGTVASRFLGYDQQDAQEFLRFLLDALHDDTNRITSKPPYKELVEKPVADVEMSTEWWDYYSARSNSTVKDLFAGQLKTQVTCTMCGTKSRAFDPFWDLAVPIPKTAQARDNHRMHAYSSSFESAPSSCSIMDCLRAFVKEEELAGSESPYCSKCKKHAPAKKTMTLYRLPPVLVLHIKRFTFSTYRRTKLNTSVEFPTSGLDVRECADTGSPFISAKESCYDLVAVSNHSGSLGGGHYTADALNVDTKKWYTFNDSHVSEGARLSQSAAYLLFYVQRGHMAPRL